MDFRSRRDVEACMVRLMGRTYVRRHRASWAVVEETDDVLRRDEVV